MLCGIRAIIRPWVSLGPCNAPQAASAFAKMPVGPPEYILQCARLMYCHLAYSQCRMPIDGVWSDKPSWQCQKPGDTPSSGDFSELNSNASSLSGGLSNLGGSSNLGDGSGGVSSQSQPAASSSSSLSAASTPAPQMGSMDTGSDTTPEMYANASASLGGCTGLAVPAGWDGVASTSVYGFYMRILTMES